jgi:putative flippase GtrA
MELNMPHEEVCNERTFSDSRIVVLNRTLVAQFVKFAAVGVLGFVVNLGMVHLLMGRVGPYRAGAAAFLAAASVTWLINRAWTFRDRARSAASRQWIAYLAANLLGFALYYATYAGLVTLLPLCLRYPVLPVAAGSIVGLFANFASSRRLVFR